MPENDFYLLALVARVVAAHASNNATASGELRALIDEVYGALHGLSNAAAAQEPDERQPAVPIKKSVLPDYIICLEDGRKLRTLRRHLWSAFSLTPEAYRERWGLPADYPMVAPSYAAQRSHLAKAAGLGKFGRLSVPKAEETKGPVIQKVPEGVSGKKLRRRAA